MVRIGAPRSTRWCVAGLVCAALLPAAFSQISAHDRIAQEVSRSQMTVLRGNVHPLAQIEFDRGRVEPDMPMQGVSITFSLSPAQQAALQGLLAAQQEPASPLYHKWLTPEEYAARFGMSQNDLDKVSQWLKSEGFTDLSIPRGRRSIAFNGTASEVESAFRTEIHRYVVHGETHFANASELSVPSALANVILGMRKLDDFQPHPRARKLPSTHFTSAQTANHFLSPGDFATIYNLAPLYTAGFDGSGTTIAVMGQTLIDVSDANAFRSAAGLPANPPQLVPVPGTGPYLSCSGDLNEADLDVEWSGGVAKNATVLFVYAGVGPSPGTTCNNRNSNVFDALQYTIDNNLAPVISISYGNCEALFSSPANTRALETIIQEANTQGQTLSAASGDSGAADCESSSATVATHGLAVDVPAAIPEVTGVGGTEFTGDDTNGADPPYWAAASGSNDNINSALTYIPEMVWNDSPITGTGPVLSRSLSAGGGGVSTLFTSKPSWQSALTPADGARDVPDIALAASPNHDGYLVCSQGSCVNGFRLANGDLTVFGGTSVSAQVFAGILDLINQTTQSGGLGNANIELYKLAAPSGTPAAFHDVTSGSNIVPCTPGTPSTGSASLRCPSTGAAQIGYSAKAGYDLASGLGSVDADALARAWPGFSSSSSYTVSGPAITIASAGSSGTSTITVSSTTGFSGTINLTCAFVPPQSASVGVSCSFDHNSVTLSNSTTSATATLTVSTTAAHAISKTSADGGARRGWFLGSGGAFLACIFVIGIPGRKRRTVAWLALIFCATGLAAIGCGGGSSGGSSGGGSTTTPTVATPVFTPAAGTYTGSVIVSVSDTTSGALLFCTTDGSTPTASSPACATQNLSSTTTLQAIATETGYNNSAVDSGTYTIQSGTPAGAYVVKVTAASTSPAESQSANVNVTVN